jgi:flavin-dependent dehydrogenase
MSRRAAVAGECDVVVVGGGPAGATVAALVATTGRRVQLFERDRFPRFHVGESLVPETFWVLKRLGMLPKLRRSRFVRKHSVQFVSGSGKASAPFYFRDNRPHECSQTWQVVRSEFDQLMLDNAREHGAVVHEGARVVDVRIDDEGRARGVKVRTRDGAFAEVRAPVTVDATGQVGLLQSRLGLRVWDPILSKGSVWTYWKGARRDEGLDEGATLVIQTPDRQGWFWFIPLHDDRASVGVVAPVEQLFKSGRRFAAAYEDAVRRCPAVHERVAGAERVTGHFAAKDYSYRSRRLAGDGWVLVGDAFAFLDPLYSSGVLLALKSGELAADAIGEGLAKGDTSAQQLGKWGPGFAEGVDRMRRLVCAYYDGFNFGRFVKAHPDLQGAITDLLIGDLFTDTVDRVWGPLEELRGPGRAPFPRWDAGVSAEAAPGKENTLYVPRGRRP